MRTHRQLSRPRFMTWRLSVIGTGSLLLGIVTAPTHAQHTPPNKPHPPTEHSMPMPMGKHASMSMEMKGPLGISMGREGSGTSWLPDNTPMYALHRMSGLWMLMLHENAFIQYIDEGGDRGDDDFGSINWVMGMARRKAMGGDLTFRGMLSAEPFTVGECGYPVLLATGESCKGGQRIHDRQHPHDLFMEIAASFERELSPNLAFQVYVAPVGEPALGPTAYPHRLSALPNPIAPIGHHWFDATHISFGVVTAGIFGRKWKLEGSAFNGREPDENRYDLDLDSLDSYSGRLTVLPTENWSLQASIGRLIEAEPGQDGEPPRDITRPTFSASYHQSLANGGHWTNTAAWGRNDEDGEKTDAFLIESSLNLAERDIFFARAELTEKSGENLVLENPLLEERIFNVSTVGVGYVRQLSSLGRFVPSIGIRGGVSFVPRDLEPFYGTRTPVSIAVFISLRPMPMRMESLDPMQHSAPAH